MVCHPGRSAIAAATPPRRDETRQHGSTSGEVSGFLLSPRWWFLCAWGLRVNRAQRIELTYKQRLKQSLNRGELSREEYDDALKMFHDARDGKTNTAELGVRVMQIFTEFLATPDCRATLESWARVNHRDTWIAFDKACNRDLDCSPWDLPTRTD